MFRRRKKKIDVSLELAPMIDVVFLLLIFFMVSTTFVSQTGIKIKLPSATTAKEQKYKDIVITVTKHNKIYFLDKLCNLTELSKLVLKEKKLYPHKKVIIKGDKEAEYQTIIDVLDILRSSKIEAVALATQKR